MAVTVIDEAFKYSSIKVTIHDLVAVGERDREWEKSFQCYLN